MWELMRIGLEMQERMIEVHAKGIDMARDMLNASEVKGEMGLAALDVGEAMNQASRAQADMVSGWMKLWGGRS